MTRYYTFHEQSSHPDEWFCSTEQKWKPKSEFAPILFLTAFRHSFSHASQDQVNDIPN
jgi:hypothetical protein